MFGLIKSGLYKGIKGGFMKGGGLQISPSQKSVIIVAAKGLIAENQYKGLVKVLANNPNAKIGGGGLNSRNTVTV